MRTLRAFALLGGLATATIAGGEAQAAACATDGNFQGAQIANVLGAGTCSLMGGQITFDLTNNNLPSGATIAFVESPNGFLVYIQPSATFVTSGTGSVQYTLASLTGPLAGVRLDSNSGSGTPPTVVTKEILQTNTFLTSTNGSVSETSLTSQTLLTITDTFTVSAVSGVLFSFSNEFYVPEPMTIGMFGVGLAGLGWARRRRTVA